MTNTKKLFLAVTGFTLLACLTSNAQTNVSGGIYTNTTWTLANSPYIVTDTVVVFPGVTLTIEPGVVVRFDNGFFLEMRNANLVAVGTAADSIIFTSNSSAPVSGIWGRNNGGIWVNGNSPSTAFRFCRIEYATIGINCTTISYVKNSVFLNNNTGIYSVYFPLDTCVFKYNTIGIHEPNNITMNFCNISNNTTGVEYLSNCVLNNCILDSNATAIEEMYKSKMLYSSISHNQSGVRTHVNGGSVIQNCVISYNSDYGVTFEPGDTLAGCELKYNDVGVYLAGHVFYGGHQVIDCDIEFNSVGVYSASNYSITSEVTKCNISNNDVGITIFNTNVNIHCNRICNNNSFGLLMNTPSPFAIPNNYWCTSDSASTAALIYDGYDNVTYGLVTFLPNDTNLCYAPAGIAEAPVNSVALYPNPSTGKFTVSNLQSGIHAIEIYNLTGENIFTASGLNRPSYTVDCGLFPKGIYFVSVNDGEKNMLTKLILE